MRFGTIHLKTIEGLRLGNHQSPSEKAIGTELLRVACALVLASVLLLLVLVLLLVLLLVLALPTSRVSPRSHPRVRERVRFPAQQSIDPTHPHGQVDNATAPSAPSAGGSHCIDPDSPHFFWIAS